ncbi:MAG: acyl carrier protein [Brevundimonas sp.]|nr:MAG: acyl carrier protein [Brevundimonas sp.]
MDPLVTLNQIFQDELDNPSLQITPETSRDDLESWDSLAHVRLIASIEEQFGFEFTLDQIEGVDSVQKILDIISSQVS